MMYAATIKGRTVFVSHTAVAGLFWSAFMIVSALLPVAVPEAVCNTSIHHAIAAIEQNLTASKNLSSNWRCTWNLEAPTDYIIKLTFERKSPYMGTSVNCDKGNFLEIRDGKNTSSQLVKNSCQGHFWNNFPLDKPFYSINNQLSIIFSSGTYNFSQIVISYQAVKPAPSCLSSWSLDSNLNIFVSGSHGNISLPGAAKECLWRVVAPPNHVVKVVLPKLPCPSFLHIMIYDGVYGMSDPAMWPDKSCALLPPSLETVYSTGRYLSIHVRNFLNTVPVGRYSANISTVMQEQTGLCGVQSNATSHITLEGREGSIFIPKYGNRYQNWGSNRHCIWTIKVPSNHIIKLQFNRLSNMNEGYLEVKDGRHGSGVQLLRFCDLAFREDYQDFPPPVYTSGQYLQLILNYKLLIVSSMPWTGFLAIYQAVSEVPPATRGICSSNNTIALNNDIRLKDSAGSFRSPNYPRKFPRSISCTWKITAPLGKRIKLTFKKGGSVGYKLEDCLFSNMDYLEFRDGFTADSSEIRKKYCGNDLPTVVSSGREMSVRLFANCKEDTADYGFEAYYETELTGGTIALIVVVVLLVVAVIVVVVFCCVYKKKRTGSLKSSNVSYSKPPADA